MQQDDPETSTRADVFQVDKVMYCMLRKRLVNASRQHRCHFRLCSSGDVGMRNEGKLGTLEAVADGGSNEQSPIHCQIALRVQAFHLHFIRLISLKARL